MEQAHPSAGKELKELQTRFLYPFFFEPGTVERASSLVRELSLAGKPGIWRCGERDDVYEEETLPHVTRFLFPHSNGAARCSYLEVENDALNRIFHDGLVLDFPAGNNSTKKLIVQRAGIEVFLNEHGVGILSLNLKLEGESFALMDALAFNYRLVQPRQKSPTGLRLPHPLHEPEQFLKMPEDQRRKSPPADDAPLAERLGVRGGRFWLSELAQTLLQPLTAVGFQSALRSDLVQAQFWIYSVARFDASVNLSDAQTRRQFAPFLSALAQVEEPGHAGAIEDDLGLPSAILNTKHWSAVGLMGVVHLIADQASNHPFNKARAHRVVRKYFVPYLMALLQRLMLQRAMSEASTLVKSPDAAAKLASLRQSLLEFGAGGHFGQVSSRHAVQRFFAVSEEGLGINGAWQEVRQAIEDLDAKFTAEQSLKLASDTKQLAESQNRATEKLIELTKDVKALAAEQKKVADEAAENVRLVARVQTMVEWIEIFLVSVYAAHLWHMFASDVDSLHHVAPAGVILFAILGAGITAFVLKPWRHKAKGGP
jgi:hypothetical protein